MSRPILGHFRSALAALLLLAVALPGCAKRFGGPWPFGADETADLAKYGPVGAQRIGEMQAKAKKIAKGTPEEQEAFAADLAKKMQQETNCSVRLAMIAVLTKINTPSSNAVLYAGMKDPEADVRVACCDAWAMRPGEQATHILAETLASDTDHDVRLAAVKALSHAKDKEAVKALGVALEDPDPSMQFVAVNSMRDVTGQNLGTDVKQYRELAKKDDPPLRTKTVAERLRDLF